MWIRTAVLLAIFLASAAVRGGKVYGATAADSASSTPAPGAMDISDRRKKCQQQWKEYRESQACFALFRLVNGGVKAEAFKYCREVKQPELCE